MKKTTEKTNETKSWTFEKINLINHQPDLSRKKEERTQIKLEMKKEKLHTADTTEIKRIVRDYYKQIYDNKIENLEEMDTFQYNLPRLNQEEIENINRPITSNEIKTVIKNLPTNKSPGPDGFTGDLDRTFREELTPITLKLFQKTTEGGIFPNSSYKATITLTPKPEKDITKKENYRAVTLINMEAKLLNKYSFKLGVYLISSPNEKMGHCELGEMEVDNTNCCCCCCCCC